MQFQSILVSKQESGQRIDQMMSKKLSLSRNQIQRLVLNGDIRINNSEIKKTGRKLEEGDKISYRIPEAKKTELKAQNIPLNIIFEDKNLLVVNKSPGIVVHPDQTGHSDNTIVNAIMHHAKDLSGIGGELRPGIVHRLDKDTSGVLLIAKNDKTHQKLTEAFKEREVEKNYLALVLGSPKTKTGKIEAPIRRNQKNRKKMGIHSQGKNAISHFEVIEKFPGVTLLKVNIETGRTHQIRVHLASIGLPVVMDSKYGNKKFNEEFKKKYGLERQFLHASELNILNKKFQAELAEDLSEVLDKLRST